MDSFIRFACGQCGKKLKAPIQSAGVSTKCPKCGTPCKVPDAAEIPPSPEPQAPPPVPPPADPINSESPSSNLPLWIGGGVVAAVLALATVVLVAMNMGSGEGENPPGQQISNLAGTDTPANPQALNQSSSDSPSAQQSNITRPPRYGGSYALTAGGLPMQPIPLEAGQAPPKNLIGVLGDGRFRHGNVVRKVVASPDGTQVLTVAGNPETLHMWDAKSGHIQYILPGIRSGNRFRSAAFSPDGTKLATYGDYQDISDSAVRVHDSSTGELLAERSGLGRIGSGIKSVSFSPDGNFVLVDEKHLFDTATLKDSTLTTTYLPERSSSRSTTPFYHVQFSPDGKTAFLKIGSDKVVWVEVGSGSEILRFEDRSCRLSIDGNFLSVEKGDELHIFDSNGKLHGKTERRSNQTVIDDAWIYNEETGLVAGVELINYETGAKQYIIEPRRVGTLHSLHLQRFNQLLLFPSAELDQMSVYDLRNRKLIASFPSTMVWRDPVVSADHQWFGHFLAKEGIVNLDNAENSGGGYQLSINHGTETRVPVFALDISTNANAAFAAIGTELVKWDLSSGSKLIREDDFIREPGALSIAPNLRYLACAMETYDKTNGTFVVWDLADATSRNIAIDRTEKVSGIAFSPDGQNFFASEQDASRLIEVAGERERYQATRSGNRMSYFSMNGTHIFTPDRTLDATNGDVIHDLDQPRLKSLWAYSPEHEVAVLSGEVGCCVIYDPKTNRVLSAFKAHYGPMGFLTGPDQLAIWNRKEGAVELISLVDSRNGLVVKGAEINDNTMTPLIAYGDHFRPGNNSGSGFSGQSPQEILERQKKMKFPEAQSQKVMLQGMDEGYTGSAPHFIGGNRVAVGSGNSLKVWNARTGEVLLETQIGSDITAMASSMDGRYIAVSTPVGQILIFDVDAN
ncbi:WD domain, G-beta repeat [Bremerella volcania]|uniref:WD domain, G-beta repeat n=1 Tax=Bremerella volcania TaxID=2527984 RepID=A0A518C886_9BACT|nr:WD40 repeat domain-containing protein [Bremerella volcania]QDU75420.1 WD domain, G-beta repeat [Bremerella volcania]